MLIGPDPNIQGYSAGPKRLYSIKFAEEGSLGLKLDIVTGSASTKKVVVANPDAKVCKALITGAKEGSQADRVFNCIDGLTKNQIVNSTIFSINGMKTQGLEEAQILSALKVTKRPLSLTVSVSDEVFSELRAQHAESVTQSRKGLSKEASANSSPAPGSTTPATKATQSSSKLYASKFNNKSNYRKLKVVRVKFVEGPLGLKLKETKSCGGAVIITGFVRDKDNSLLQAEQMGVLEVGMIMLAIEKTVVFGHPFETVMDIIKKTARPMTMLFVRSPDLQVIFPPHITSITSSQLVLGTIEGYCMVTANSLVNVKPTATEISAAAEGDAAMNCDKLIPGMVILQVDEV